jgi:hypothetical protein
LYASINSGWILQDTGITSFAFAPLGTNFGGNVFALQAGGALYASINSGWILQDTGITSFAFAPLGTNFGGNVFALQAGGALYASTNRGWILQDSGVTSFAFGAGESAGYLVVLTSSGLLEGDSGNGFQQWVAAVQSFVVDSQTGAIDYVTTSGKHGVYVP